EVASLVEGKVVGCGTGSWHRPLVPDASAAIGCQRADGIGGWFGKPDGTGGVYREKQRCRIAGWLGVIMHQRKTLTVILRDVAGGLLGATDGSGIAARLGNPGIADGVKTDAPGNS